MLFLTKEFILIKNTFLNSKIKIERETTTKTRIKNKLKCSPMSDDDTRIAEPNLEVLPLT